MMIKVDSSRGATLTIERTPNLAKRYMVTMKAGSVTVMVQATDALFLNWEQLNADGFVNYRLNDETDVAVVRQFLKETQK